MDKEIIRPWAKSPTNWVLMGIAFLVLLGLGLATRPSNGSEPTIIKVGEPTVIEMGVPTKVKLVTPEPTAAAWYEAWIEKGKDWWDSKPAEPVKVLSKAESAVIAEAKATSDLAKAAGERDKAIVAQMDEYREANKSILAKYKADVISLEVETAKIRAALITTKDTSYVTTEAEHFLALADIENKYLKAGGKAEVEVVDPPTLSPP